MTVLSAHQRDKLLQLLKLGVVPVRAGDRTVPILIRLGLAVPCKTGGVTRTSRPRFVRLTRKGGALARGLEKRRPGRG